MNDEKWMRLAIKGAKKAEAKGQPPVFSVMIKDGKVIAQGESTVGKTLDPSAHNDKNCIKAACKKLKSAFDLSGCTMYSTIEPCSMCLGCAAWAGLPKIIFGAYQKDISKNPYEIKGYSAEKQAKRMNLANGKKMIVKGGVLQKKCAKLFKNYCGWVKTK